MRWDEVRFATAQLLVRHTSLLVALLRSASCLVPLAWNEGTKMEPGDTWGWYLSKRGGRLSSWHACLGPSYQQETAFCCASRHAEASRLVRKARQGEANVRRRQGQDKTNNVLTPRQTESVGLQ